MNNINKQIKKIRKYTHKGQSDLAKATSWDLHFGGRGGGHTG